MKKTIYSIAATVFMAGTLLTSYDAMAQKTEKSSTNKAKQNLNQAQEDYTAEVKKLRKETDEKIAANKKRIAELKADILKEKQEARADYNKKIADLEQKNEKMKKKMDEFKEEGKDKWESFKTEFNHDMEGLEKSLKDFSTNNKK